MIAQTMKRKQRRLSIFTLTDRTEKQGDYVRMENIISRLAQEVPLRVVRIPGYNEERWKKLGKYPYFLVKEIARAFLLLRALFMSSRNIFYTSDWLVARNLALLSYLKKIDFVMEVNGLHSYELEIRNYFNRSTFAHKHFICRGERLALKRAALVVAVSKGLKETLVREYDFDPDKALVSENGADTQLFPCHPPPENQEPFRIGWAGSFQPYEGFDLFILLARKFKEEGRNIQFLIVGDSPVRPQHEAKIRQLGLEDYFEFKGRVEWQKVPEALAPAHCCLMIPNLSETGLAYRDVIGVTQIKTYEYMAMGKPIVTFNLGDAVEIIEGNGIGVTCEPNEESLKNALVDMPKRDLKQMSKKARELAESEYNWSATTRKILKGLERFFPRKISSAGRSED